MPGSDGAYVKKFKQWIIKSQILLLKLLLLLQYTYVMAELVNNPKHLQNILQP